MKKSYWKSGDSKSIRLTDRITPRTYEALNSKEMMIRHNRNRFITKAINNQVILEYGTIEEKIRLLGIDDLSELLISLRERNYTKTEKEDIRVDSTVNTTSQKVIRRSDKEKNSIVTDIISSMPTI